MLVILVSSGQPAAVQTQRGSYPLLSLLDNFKHVISLQAACGQDGSQTLSCTLISGEPSSYTGANTARGDYI